MELTWRKEFDKLGEKGVHHEFFKGAFQANQKKEAFAYRWFGEKRKGQQREEAGRKHQIGLVAVFTLLCLVVVAAVALYFGFGEILNKAASVLRFSWKAIADILGTSP